MRVYCTYAIRSEVIPCFLAYCPELEITGFINLTEANLQTATPVQDNDVKRMLRKQFGALTTLTDTETIGEPFSLESK
jgi:hypothetical protein